MADLASETATPRIPTHRRAPAATDRYVAVEPWSPQRPEALVICCSDGRWYAQITDFVRARVSPRSDFYAVPGGPAGFNLWGSSFEASWMAEKALKFLVEHHELRSVWLIAHQGCAYYQDRYGMLDPAEIPQRQEEDLERAQEVIGRWFPSLLVQKVYASREGDRVVFSVLPDRTRR